MVRKKPSWKDEVLRLAQDLREVLGQISGLLEEVLDLTKHVGWKLLFLVIAVVEARDFLRWLLSR